MILRRRKFVGLMTGFTVASTTSIFLSRNETQYLKLNRKRDLPFNLGWYEYINNTNFASQIPSKYIDLLMPYTEQSEEKIQEFLDASKQAGVKVLVELYRPLVESENILGVKNFIRTYKNHPSVYGWYLYDEPEIKKPTPLSPDLLKRVYQAIKEEDSSKPVGLVFADIKKIEPYADAMDILMWDRYPCEEGVSEFQWAPSYRRALYKVVSLANAKNKKFWNVLQAYSEKQSKKRLPTKLEFRYMFYLSVLTGADGLLFWAHFLSSPSWNKSVLYPTIDEFRDYIPAIVRGEDLSNSVRVNSSDIQVNLFAIANSNKYIIVLVNHNHNQIYFTVTLNSNLAGKEVAVNQKTITKLSTKASFSFLLNPFDVRLYEIG
jgi:hypothetical protein